MLFTLQYNLQSDNLATVPYIKSQYSIAKLFELNKYALKRRIYNINWGFGILVS